MRSRTRSRTRADTSMTGQSGYYTRGRPLPHSMCDGRLLVLCILTCRNPSICNRCLKEKVEQLLILIRNVPSFDMERQSKKLCWKNFSVHSISQQQTVSPSMASL